MNLNELLEKSARDWPQKPAIIEGETTTSYSALAEIVSVTARRLAVLSLPLGCRVGLQVPGSLDYIVLTYALWHVQAVVVPIPVECPDEEVAELVEKMQLEAILSDKPGAAANLFQAGFYFTRLQPAVSPDNHGLNIAFIRFTSGTTSARKGVVLCHETIRDRILSANKAFDIGPADVVMWNLPMSHHFLITIVLYLSQGTTIVLAQHVLPRLFLAEVNRHQGTVLYSAPRYYALLARDDSAMQMPSVRMAISTTSSLTEEVAHEFYRRYHRPLTPALGIMELGLVAINDQDSRQRWNSVGLPAGDFHVRIAEPDQSGCGELAVSGPGMLDAYAAPWIAREKILRDGWFRTGDIARMDADGFIYLLSRKTAVIHRGGQKVFPEEVEMIINRHPDVRESHVYGRQDPRLGETVEADLVPERDDLNLTRIREFCRKHLAPFKIPTRMRIVKELPRTAVTGKIQRVRPPMPPEKQSAFAKVASMLIYMIANSGGGLIFMFTSG